MAKQLSLHAKVSWTVVKGGVPGRLQRHQWWSSTQALHQIWGRGIASGNSVEEACLANFILVDFPEIWQGSHEYEPFDLLPEDGFFTMDDDGSFRLTRSRAPYSKWSKIKAPSSFNTEELFLRLEEWLLAEEADSELGDGDSELLAESNLDLDNSGEESPELTDLEGMASNRLGHAMSHYPSWAAGQATLGCGSPPDARHTSTLLGRPSQATCDSSLPTGAVRDPSAKN
ncbi:hypothetical protein BJV77DRAFT_968268 [Russula vinacea]|nr:hypothetical protein BJV77DRAFT_968268 [Russula vinacea]